MGEVGRGDRPETSFSVDIIPNAKNNPMMYKVQVLITFDVNHNYLHNPYLARHFTMALASRILSIPIIIHPPPRRLC